MIRTKEVEDFIETWARYCGAPKSVFIGHVDKMLESVVKDHESRISSLEAALSKYEAFWNWSRETDKMQFEKEYEHEKPQASDEEE